MRSMCHWNVVVCAGIGSQRMTVIRIRPNSKSFQKNCIPTWNVVFPWLRIENAWRNAGSTDRSSDCICRLNIK